jgi:hypothetical protein
MLIFFMYLFFIPPNIYRVYMIIYDKILTNNRNYFFDVKISWCIKILKGKNIYYNK